MTRAPRPNAVFRAVSDPTRRAILDRLRHAPLRAGEIAGLFTVSRPAISRHLRVLRAARLVKPDRRGREMVYMLNPAPLQALDEWLHRYRQFWAAKLLDLKEFVESRVAATTASPGNPAPSASSRKSDETPARPTPNNSRPRHGPTKSDGTRAKPRQGRSK